MTQTEANEYYQTIIKAIGAGMGRVSNALSLENKAVADTSDATLKTNMTNAAANLSGQIATLSAAQQSVAFSMVPLSPNTQYTTNLPPWPLLPSTPTVPVIVVPNPPAYNAPPIVT